MMRFMLSHLGTGSPSAAPAHDGRPVPRRRVATAVRQLRRPLPDLRRHRRSARLGAEVRRSLAQAFERWDGKGVPGRLAGDAIDPVMRIVQIANDAEVSRAAGGPAAVAMLRRRRGTEFDPELVDLVCTDADEILGDLDELDGWDAVIDGCAALDRRIAEAELDAVLALFADYADLKSPWFTGHSRAVAASPGGRAAQRTGRPTTSAWSSRAGAGPPPRRDRRLHRRSGTSRAADADRAGTGAHPPVPHRADLAPPAAAGRHRRRWRRCTTSGSTGRATRAAWPARRCPRRRDCSPRPTSTRRWPRTGPDGRPARPSERRAACAPRSAPGGSTAAPSSRAGRRRVTGCAVGHAGRRAHRSRGRGARSCSSAAGRTSRSPSGWSSRRAPSAPRRAHLRQDRRVHARRRGHVRAAARPGRRRGGTSVDHPM